MVGNMLSHLIYCTINHKNYLTLTCPFPLFLSNQVKRAAARKAYLASLQTKPKVSFRNVNCNSKNTTSNNPKIKTAPKQTLKPKLVLNLLVKVSFPSLYILLYSFSFRIKKICCFFS